MLWDRNHNSPNVEDRRNESSGGGLGGGGLPLGALLAVGSRFGWKGILVALLVVGGVMYSGVCTGGGGTSAPSHTTSTQQAPAGAPGGGPTDEGAKFVGVVLDDTQEFWAKQLGNNYETTKLVLFRGQIGSACGSASTAVGPFYCPVDHKVYIDLAFYDELRTRFEAPGDFAQAYVIAHEMGHHIQNLKGLLGKGEASSVNTELQADCLAGAWGQDAQRRGQLETGDVDEALNAASQIGDDTIQRKTQGRVQPETFTHGSSAQRNAAFKKGFTGGPSACGI